MNNMNSRNQSALEIYEENRKINNVIHKNQVAPNSKEPILDLGSLSSRIRDSSDQNKCFDSKLKFDILNQINKNDRTLQLLREKKNVAAIRMT